jgi:hypothetical protein
MWAAWIANVQLVTKQNIQRTLEMTHQCKREVRFYPIGPKDPSAVAGTVLTSQSSGPNLPTSRWLSGGN